MAEEFDEKLRTINSIVQQIIQEPDNRNGQKLKELQQSIIAHVPNAIVQIVEAFRFSGALDYVEDAGVDKHVGLMRLLSNLLIDDSDHNVWSKSPSGRIYDAVGNALSSLGSVHIKRANVRDGAPVQVLAWSAFADGSYLNARRQGWPGVIDDALVESHNLVQWFVSPSSEDAGRSRETSYSQYVDYMHDQFERRFEAVDIVFTDLIALNELWEKRLIEPLSTVKDEDRKILEPLHLGRVAELGRLVTINYHVPAISTALLAAGSRTVSPHRAAAKAGSMYSKKNAEIVFEYSAHEGKEFDSGAKFSAPMFDAPTGWLTGLKNGVARSDGYCLSKGSYARLWLGAQQAGPIKKIEDPQFAYFGRDHPVAPLQLAPGPHATYTTFAMFANCSSRVESLIKQTNLDNEQSVWDFREIGGTETLTLQTVLKDPRVSQRSNRVLLMPDRESLVSRSRQFFNFLWHFVPATSLTYDHVTASIVRCHDYKDVWFDPCLPVEAVLFHADQWAAGREPLAALGDAPVTLGGRSLSCFGGYSFALSTRSFAGRRAAKAIEDLASVFQSKLKDEKAGPYKRLDPAMVSAETLHAVAKSAVRPTVAYWPLIDGVISETVRLYASALFVARAIRAHCTASLTGEAGLEGTEGLSVEKEAWITYHLGDAGDSELGMRIKGLAGNRLTIDQLDSIVHTNMDHEMTRRALQAIAREATAQIERHVSVDVTAARDSLKATIADSDYVSGIVRSCRNLNDFAEHFIETVTTKVELIAQSKHWKVLHVYEQP